jgi:2-aminobenzoate-CoA ligase
LPPIDQWPDLLLDRPEFQYPPYLNVAVELTDRMVEKGFGDHVALIGNGRRRTYKELLDWTNRLATTRRWWRRGWRSPRWARWR